MSARLKIVSIQSRVDDYAKEGMFVFDKSKKIMMCRFCNVRVNFERKSVVDFHCNSLTHQEKKRGPKQVLVSESFAKTEKMSDDREKFIKSTVNAFLKANIPINKLDNSNLRDWIKEYIPGKLLYKLNSN